MQWIAQDEELERLGAQAWELEASIQCKNSYPNWKSIDESKLPYIFPNPPPGARFAVAATAVGAGGTKKRIKP